MVGDIANSHVNASVTGMFRTELRKFRSNDSIQQLRQPSADDSPCRSPSHRRRDSSRETHARAAQMRRMKPPNLARLRQRRCFTSPLWTVTMPSPAWGIGERAGRNSDNEEVSWSSDLEVHAPFIGHARSSPARSAGIRCLLRNGASISTTAASGICGPVTHAATSSRARSAIRRRHRRRSQDLSSANAVARPCGGPRNKSRCRTPE